MSFKKLILLQVPPVSPTPTDVESEIDIAREEIAKLRIARDVFVTHRTEVGVRLKMVSGYYLHIHK